MPKKLASNLLASREDFAVNQFMTMRKMNTIMTKLFDTYYIDIDSSTELSIMMRSMVPPYYVDPNNPEHPSCYVFAGKSSVPYLERIVYMMPYVTEKRKYEGDISAWKGMIFNPADFHAKAKGFRKTKLHMQIIMGERLDGERYCETMVLREEGGEKADTCTIPFLMLPNRHKDGDNAYFNTIKNIIYNPFYVYIPQYLTQNVVFETLSEETLQTMKENYMVDVTLKNGDIITLTKNILPTVDVDHRVSIGLVPEPDIDTSTGKRHYIVCDETLNDVGAPFIQVFTLMAILTIPANY